MSVPAAIVMVLDPSHSHDAVERVGPEIAARVEAIGGDVLAIELVPIGGELFEERLQHYIDEQVPLLLTCGGSGIGPEDIVPELTSIIVERRVPGLEEVLRRALAAEGPSGAFERGGCGIAGETLVVNLPRSVRLAETALAALAPLLPSLQARLAGFPEPDEAASDDDQLP